LPTSVLVSPRNKEKAEALAAKFPHLVQVAETNQDVVDGSDIVLIGTLPKAGNRTWFTGCATVHTHTHTRAYARHVSPPSSHLNDPPPPSLSLSRSLSRSLSWCGGLQAAEGILQELCFRREQTVISIVAMITLSQLEALVAPVPRANISRVCPLPPIARHLGATIVCPKHAVTAALFDSFGATVSVDTEEQLAQLLVNGCC
jgi:pyrroline-5-carboxylate reductase